MKRFHDYDRNMPAYTRRDTTFLPISAVELSLLRSVAAMTDPFAAYGRSLLYTLTGEKIEPTLPETTQRSQNMASEPKVEKYSIHPNPATDHINIEIENISSNSLYEYLLMDGTGHVLLRNSINTHQASQDISDLPAGIYFIQIFKDNNAVTIQKVAILK